MAAATQLVKFDVTSNSKNSRKDLEREAVDSFCELERAERAAKRGPMRISSALSLNS